MKKIKILALNICAIILIIITCEIIAYAIEYSILIRENVATVKDSLHYYFKVVKNFNNKPINLEELRKPLIKNKTHKNIILLGCSYTWEHMLNEIDTFGYKLAEKTHMNVYNFSVPSTGLREMLYILRNKEILNTILSEQDKNSQQNKYYAEYAIYTYITDHKRRLIYDLNTHAPHYKITKDNKLILENNKIYYCSFLYRQLKELTFKCLPKEYIDNLFYIYIKAINEEIKQKFHNTENKPCEFIIFVYNNDDEINWERISKLDGVRIIRRRDLTAENLDNINYRISETDLHPNARVWEVCVPQLVKKLNL